MLLLGEWQIHQLCFHPKLNRWAPAKAPCALRSWEASQDSVLVMFNSLVHACFFLFLMCLTFNCLLILLYIALHFNFSPPPFCKPINEINQLSHVFNALKSSSALLFLLFLQAILTTSLFMHEMNNSMRKYLTLFLCYESFFIYYTNYCPRALTTLINVVEVATLSLAHWETSTL